MKELLIIALGGSIGAILRYEIGNIAAAKFSANFPYGTWIANIIGCFIIGIFMTLITEKINAHPYWRLLVTVGFLGSLTTFSSFSYETIKLLQDANYITAFANIAANLCLGFLATFLGIISIKLLY